MQLKAPFERNFFSHLSTIFYLIIDDFFYYFTKYKIEQKW